MSHISYLLGAVVVNLGLLSMAQAQTVVIESNQPDQNSLLSFQAKADGTLDALPTLLTGGKGVVDPTLALGPFDSDQELIMNSDRTLIFAVNTGSNSISVFHRSADGKIAPVWGSPFDSHGVGPVSVGLKGNILTVVNKHGDPAQAMDGSLPNYSTFKLSSDGGLTWNGMGSETEVANGSSPSQALVSPLAPVIFGADFLGGILRSFYLRENGSLVAVSSEGLPASEFSSSETPRLPLGLAANPRVPLLYVGFPTDNKIGVYSYERNGRIHFKGAVDDSGNVVCWLLTNRQGTRLYASNTADPSITVYDIESDPASPQELGKLKLPSQGGAYQLALSPDERTLFVLTQRFQATTPEGMGNEIHSLSVDPVSGLVTELPASPKILHLESDTRPQGILVY